MNKRLDEMSTDELLAFKQKYIVITSAAPAAIEAVLADDEANDEQLSERVAIGGEPAEARAPRV